MPYVDGFVIPIPKKNIAAYKKIAQIACAVWKDYGALEYRECVGDDLKTQFGISFSKLAKAKPGETVIFAWITYKSKAHRNAVNKKVMKDPRILASCKKKMPFDVKHLTYGGFKVIVGY